MTAQPSTQETTDRSGTTCPVCASAAQRGQLVCLECGSRITLGYRRPPSWKVPVAIVAAVLMLTGAGGALAYRAVDDDAQREASRTPANPKDTTKAEDDANTPAADSDQTPKEPSETSKDADDEIRLGADAEAKDDPVVRAEDQDAAIASPTAGADGLRKSGDLFTWPRDLRAFTVVLLSAEDRVSAASFARSAGGSGNDKIGVIRSADFETLPKGFFVVFAGKYPDRRRADRAAARLGRRFPGAFAQLVRK